ncbi:hypothetical protein L2E82_46759 [Cichorium intybus]|uniref:Uncharacterized protein n=1 Tax=Cichorium intybus TaxID=13427 RepID=A0ACB8YU14_CICIN|nr:hypothetical protein L2E82_46759 [Cichorium intybus]
MTGPVITTESGSTQPESADYNDPLYLHRSDNTTATIISFKLIGAENYRVWRSSMMRSLKGRNKLGFVEGSIVKPDDPAKLLKWERANSVVCSWILGSVSESIYASHACTESSFQVWTELFETYHKSDGSVIFNIHQKINSLTQSGLSVSDYYNKLDGLWKEFDGLISLPECICDAATHFNDHSKLIKLMQFLNGLDDSFNQVKSHILLMDPLPNVRSAFSIISREESRQKHGSLSSNTNNNSQPAAFNSKAIDFKRNKGRNQNLQCKHCGVKGHTIERCYKLIGYPKDFKPKNDTNNSTGFNKTFLNNNANSVSDCSLGSSQTLKSEQHYLTSEQYSKFLRLISETQGNEEIPANANANMAGIACNSFVDFKKWVVDSGANQHMTASESHLHDVVDVSKLDLKVAHPNGSSAQINKIGNLQLSNSLTLFDVFVIPGFSVNLLSVHKLCRDSKCQVVFDEHNCVVQDSRSKGTVETSSESGGLYYMTCCPSSGTVTSKANLAKYFVSKITWHNRLGHPAEQALNVLKDTLKFTSDTLPPCEVCHKAKQTRDSFSLSQKTTATLGDLLHLDVWGPYKVLTVDGCRFFLTVVDDFTRATWVYLLKSKDEVFSSVFSLFKILQNQFGIKVKVIRSDNGTEFINNRMKMFCTNEGIVHQTTCAYTPQQNGVVERKHRHILNVARSLIFEAGLPFKYWGDAVLTSVFLINRTPSSVLNGKTPYELVYKRSPKLDFLRVFGCLCFATKLNVSDKFSERAEKCVLLGYGVDKKCYKVLSLDSSHVFFSRDVRFYESVFPFKMKSDTLEPNVIFSEKINNFSNPWDPFSNDELELPDFVIKQSDFGTLGATHETDGTSANQPKDGINSGTITTDCNREWEVQVPQPVMAAPSVPNLAEEKFQHVFEEISEHVNSQTSNSNRPKRVSRMPTKFNDFVVDSKYKYGIEKSVNYSLLNDENKCFVSNLNKTVEPQSYFEAASDPNWIKAMNDEMEALYRNNTWEITDLPVNRKPIGCRWVYKIKYKSNGEIERYKARLVAKGYNQREGIDYEETFSPVAKMVTVRIVVNLAVNNNWTLFQLDINNAFLYGNLDEDVYMTLPQGYFTKEDKRVCKLSKSLYGLKQAPRKWNERLCSALFEVGFEQSMNDYSLFVKSKNGTLVVLLVYVDDIILTGNCISEINKVKGFLKSQFLIKDLGKLKFFLGIEVIDIENGVCLTQRKYCLELLHEFGMLACKPVKTPLDTNVVVKQDGVDNYDSLLTNVTEFQRLIGKLIYLTITRPDIAYTVQTLSQFMHCPRKSHLNVAFRLLRFLKQNPGKGIKVVKAELFDLKGYVDADWAKCMGTRRSVTGYCVYLGSSLISWKSKKQDTVSRSSTESEYRALGSVACEVIWVLKILYDLGIKKMLPVMVFCDNESAIKLALNPVFHEKTKHFEVDVHFIREKVSKGIIKIIKISSENQHADILTKSLSFPQHDYLCKQMGLFDPFSK